MRNPLLIQIKTEDGLTLPGLFYEAPKTNKAAIFLHGNGSSSVFYSDDLREEQVKALNSKGISYLLFNNLGAHYIKKLDVQDKICVYHYYKPNNKISKYVLLGGGDDTGIYYSELGKEKFYKLLEESKDKIRKRKGEEINCELLPIWILSAQDSLSKTL
ncbi:hypothetical protein HYT18_05170 [Candidatus Microgenomates bacterium]|nr:hypothetical protein [Candidatus Microgenomates bacterium]